jgi:RHS repeat-associated protein
VSKSIPTIARSATAFAYRDCRLELSPRLHVATLPSLASPTNGRPRVSPQRIERTLWTSRADVSHSKRSRPVDRTLEPTVTQPAARRTVAAHRYEVALHSSAIGQGRPDVDPRPQKCLDAARDIDARCRIRRPIPADLSDFGTGEDIPFAIALTPDGGVVLAGGTNLGGSGDFALARYAPGGSATQRLYALQDANYNVTALIDTSGTVVQRFQYDPYGQSTVLTSGFSLTTDGYDWLYRHQGGRLETATGTYHFRNRDYDPTLGRWLQEDPAGYVDGPNFYTYLGESPLAAVDPLGLSRNGMADRQNAEYHRRNANYRPVPTAASSDDSAFLQWVGDMATFASFPVVVGRAAFDEEYRGRVVGYYANVVIGVGEAVSPPNVKAPPPQNLMEATGRIAGRTVGTVAGVLETFIGGSAGAAGIAITGVSGGAAGVVGVPVTAAGAAVAGHGVCTVWWGVTKPIDLLAVFSTNNSGTPAGNPPCPTNSGPPTNASSSARWTAPRITSNRHGQLTNGKYILDDVGMQPHTTGSLAQGKSQFLYRVNEKQVVLDAAAYADEAGLWFGNKAKVVLDTPIGVHGQTGELTNVINIYRTKTGFVHGAPGTP